MYETNHNLTAIWIAVTESVFKYEWLLSQGFMKPYVIMVFQIQ